MSWISVEERMPNKGDYVWYYFAPVGVWKGVFDGYYENNHAMHIFKCTEIL